MAKITDLNPVHIKKLAGMFEYVNSGIFSDLILFENSAFYPFCLIQKFLPLNLKCLSESYVAVETKEPMGMISLTPDGNIKTRWIINSLLLSSNACEAGKQLIDYAVNRIGGAGAESFITVIDENHSEILSLFKNGCFFRNYSKITVWTAENLNLLPHRTISPELLRKAQKEDAKKICELDSEAILPQLRVVLSRSQNVFEWGIKSQIIYRLKDFKGLKYVLDNPKTNSIEGFISISSKDEKIFQAEIILSLAYKEHYETLLYFTAGMVHQLNPNAQLYIIIREYYQAGKKMAEVLSNNGFNICGSFQVMVRDYWKPAEVFKEKKATVNIFPDLTSPACNILK